MKYLTPALILQSRSPDEVVSEAAQKELDRNAVEYRRFYKVSKHQFPLSVRRMNKRMALHDSAVVCVRFYEEPLFVVLLERPARKGQQEGDRIELRYRVVRGEDGGVRLRPPETSLQGGRWVLCDEFALGLKEKTFVHNILLSDGSEIEVHFERFSFAFVASQEPEAFRCIERTWEPAQC